MPSIYIKVIAASSCFITALSLSSGALSTSDTEQTLSILEATMPVHTSIKDEKSGEFLLAKALDLEKNGDLESALSVLKKVIDSRVSPALVWAASLKQAEIHIASRKLSEAERVLSRFIDQSAPGIHKALAYSHRADLYEAMGNKDQATLDRENIARLR